MANQDIKSPKEFDQNVRVLEITDPAHADIFNPIFENLINNDAYLKDGIDSSDTLKAASGTATSIQLSVPNMTSYTNLRKITFVATISNEGASTTININGMGPKSLYKPNTTIAPKLTAGKAYEVWYNQASNCFFVKASAEGTAQAQHVLAPYTISNDEDTGIVGTMVDRSGDTAALALSRTGPTIKLKASQGYRDGTNDYVTHTDINDVADNIKVGITIRNQSGTFTSDADATASDIIKPKSAYVNGLKLIGTASPLSDVILNLQYLPNLYADSGYSLATTYDVGIAYLSDGYLSFRYTDAPSFALKIRKYNYAGTLQNEITVPLTPQDNTRVNYIKLVPFKDRAVLFIKDNSFNLPRRCAVVKYDGTIIRQFTFTPASSSDDALMFADPDGMICVGHDSNSYTHSVHKNDGTMISQVADLLNRYGTYFGGGYFVLGGINGDLTSGRAYRFTGAAFTYLRTLDTSAYPFLTKHNSSTAFSNARAMEQRHHGG